jgi:hypothetical protein
MMCAMHRMSFMIAGHSIPEASWVDSSSRLSDTLEPELSVVNPSKWLSLSLK